MNNGADDVKGQEIPGQVFKRSYEREKKARKEAELLLDNKSRELYALNTRLESQYGELESRAGELEFLYELGQLNGSEFSFENMLQAFVDAKCQREGWFYAHVYIPVEEDPSQLKATCIFSSSHPEKTAQLCETLRVMSFSLGDRLPGRVYQSHESEWVDQVHVDKNNPRAEMYKAFGIVSAFALPIMVSSKVVAVCESFSITARDKNLEHVRFSEVAAFQIGAAVEKNNAQRKMIKEKEALTNTNARIQYLIDNMPSIVYTSAASSHFTITSVSANIEQEFGYKVEDVLNDEDFWFKHIYEADRVHFFLELPKLWQTGEQIHEYRFQKSDGEFR
ncbi:MAG: PAS domain-containing protein [Flavobacterium sp.]|jgi:PAS domain-containing protein